jgi:hypothetical protein
MGLSTQRIESSKSNPKESVYHHKNRCYACIVPRKLVKGEKRRNFSEWHDETIRKAAPYPGRSSKSQERVRTKVRYMGVSDKVYEAADNYKRFK